MWWFVAIYDSTTKSQTFIPANYFIFKFCCYICGASTHGQQYFIKGAFPSVISNPSFPGWPRLHLSWVSPPLPPPLQCWPIWDHLHPVTWRAADSDRAKAHRGKWIWPQWAQRPRHPWWQAKRCCILLEAKWWTGGAEEARPLWNLCRLWMDDDRSLYPPPLGLLFSPFP